LGVSRASACCPPDVQVTMLRNPLHRTLSAFRWWVRMVRRFPATPAVCGAYSCAANATLGDWLDCQPDNWMVRRQLARQPLRTQTPGREGVQ
jgi:hypothetical protein